MNLKVCVCIDDLGSCEMYIVTIIRQFCDELTEICSDWNPFPTPFSEHFSFLNLGMHHFLPAALQSF